MLCTRFLLMFAAAALAAGCAATPPVRPDAQFAGFPCLGDSLPCGKIATRKVVKHELAGPLGGDAMRGRQVAEARNKGNCLACHRLRDGAQPGTTGPDLSHYGALNRTDAEIYTLVYDMRTRNPDTLMPPMGTNEILTDQEIRDVVAYLQSSR